MPQINIPDTLFHEVEKSLSGAVSPADFVVAAVEEKLTAEACKKEFMTLSDQTRSTVTEQGLTELDVLTEFDTLRHSPNG